VLNARATFEFSFSFTFSVSVAISVIFWPTASGDFLKWHVSCCRGNRFVAYAYILRFCCTVLPTTKIYMVLMVNANCSVLKIANMIVVLVVIYVRLVVMPNKHAWPKNKLICSTRYWYLFCILDIQFDRHTSQLAN